MFLYFIKYLILYFVKEVNSFLNPECLLFAFLFYDDGVILESKNQIARIFSPIKYMELKSEPAEFAYIIEISCDSTTELF